MARINLLPWRAERRAQRQKEFLAMLGLAALAGVALAFLIISWHSAQIDGQNERNEYLRTQIQSLDTQIKEIERLDEQKARCWRARKSSSSCRPAARRWSTCSIRWCGPSPTAWC
jgi:type IV pilus assembly protein PilN